MRRYATVTTRMVHCYVGVVHYITVYGDAAANTLLQAGLDWTAALLFLLLADRSVQPSRSDPIRRGPIH
eukprot:scaffold3562_cov37-Attheya_sp.AAC.1